MRRWRETAAPCNNARLDPGGGDEENVGDPTEVAVLIAARALGAEVDPERREQRRSHQYNFDAQRKLMSTLDSGEDGDWLHTKGAPESRAAAVHRDAAGRRRAASARCRRAGADGRAGGELRRPAACACWRSRAARCPRALSLREREQAERELCFLGLVTMRDPPRAEVAEAVARCHGAGIRIVLITGDHPLTAAAIARPGRHRRRGPAGRQRPGVRPYPRAGGEGASWPAGAR